MELKKQARWKLGVRVEKKNTCVYGAWRERRGRDRKGGIVQLMKVSEEGEDPHQEDEVKGFLRSPFLNEAFFFKIGSLGYEGQGHK